MFTIVDCRQCGHRAERQAPDGTPLKAILAFACARCGSLLVREGLAFPLTGYAINWELSQWRKGDVTMALKS